MLGDFSCEIGSRPGENVVVDQGERTRVHKGRPEVPVEVPGMSCPCLHKLAGRVWYHLWVDVLTDRCFGF